MGLFTQTTTFANGQTADGGQVNTEVVNLGTSVNNIVDAQVSSSAAISLSKTQMANWTDSTAHSATLESGSPDWNFASKDFYYQRIGKWVYFNFWFSGAVTTGAVSDGKISLPVSGVSGVTQTAGIGIFYDSSATASLNVQARINSGDEGNIILYYNTVSIKGSDVAASDQIWVHGFYRVA